MGVDLWSFKVADFNFIDEFWIELWGYHKNSQVKEYSLFRDGIHRFWAPKNGLSLQPLTQLCKSPLLRYYIKEYGSNLYSGNYFASVELSDWLWTATVAVCWVGFKRL